MAQHCTIVVVSRLRVKAKGQAAIHCMHWSPVTSAHPYWPQWYLCPLYQRANISCYFVATSFYYKFAANHRRGGNFYKYWKKNSNMWQWNVCLILLCISHYTCFLLNNLNAELNPICHLLALLGGATIVVVSRLRGNVYFDVRMCCRPLYLG